MKCRATRNIWLKTMLIAGAVILAAGIFLMLRVPEEGVGARMAGMLCGLGGSFALMGGGFLLYNRITGEQRTKERALRMEDERGLMVAYKAQNVAAVSAVMAIIVMLIAALIRGDSLYMTMGTVSCILVAVIKIAAYAFYDRKM